jgi:predicted PurR-regulated permease PerM
VRVEPAKDTFAGSFTPLIAPLLGPLGAAGLVVVLVIFMLLTREDLRNRLVALSGQAHVAATTKALDEAGRGIARYLLMQFVINASYGLTVTIGLLALGVSYAMLWGAAAALLRYVPYAGPLVAGVLPVGYSVLTSEG